MGSVSCISTGRGSVEEKNRMTEEEGKVEAPEPVEPESANKSVDGAELVATPSEITEKSEVSSDDRLLSALMWLSMVAIQLPILSVVLLFIEPNKSSKFQRHHAVSSIIFWVAALIYEGMATVLFTVLSVISLGCLAICGWVIFFVPHLLALYYALKAFNGDEVQIPFVTDFARRQGWI
jgi:uncharacterized membrane protein